jgi:hypothetical protein
MTAQPRAVTQALIALIMTHAWLLATMTALHGAAALVRNHAPKAGGMAQMLTRPHAQTLLLPEDGALVVILLQQHAAVMTEARTGEHARMAE